MKLGPLFHSLMDVFDGELAIENMARNALSEAGDVDFESSTNKSLPESFETIFAEPDAHPICQLISQFPFEWVPPTTSDDPAYVAHSLAKVHVELIGPQGIVRSDSIRLGLYGMAPDKEYGIRTHLAEEVFIMIAGEADWKQNDGQYKALRAGQRAFHPSMTPHANRTRTSAFLSAYAWHGDISTDSYVYEGIK